MNNANHRSSISLYSVPGCPQSHKVRLVFAEKGVDVDIHQIVDHWPEQIASVTPYGEAPVLVEQESVLFNSNIIMEYLEDRFPHPTLMPAEPLQKAQMKLMLYRIDRDWYSLWPDLVSTRNARASKARKQLLEDLIVLSPVFEQHHYFMSDEFSLIDCALAPLLWRLPSLKVKLPAKAKAIEHYANRLFARDSFVNSLSESEKQFR
ncbi:MAG: glutathione S-transferase N-terminal domain-containing protein [Methylophaga sp.]|nr:glutathione S-transferase N-terminal domain-containing protein [Methylophaga sp.]